MNAVDFAKWWEDFERRFPSKSSWANGDGERGTVETWHDVLHPCDVRDAIEANKRFQEGVESWPNDWEQIPVAIRDVAADCRTSRLAREMRERYRASEPDDLGRRGNCELCSNYGMVLKPDHKGRIYGYACPCPNGDRLRREKTDSKTGRRMALTATYQPRKYDDFAEFEQTESEGVSWI